MVIESSPHPSNVLIPSHISHHVWYFTELFGVWCVEIVAWKHMLISEKHRHQALFRAFATFHNASHCHLVASCLC